MTEFPVAAMAGDDGYAICENGGGVPHCRLPARLAGLSGRTFPFPSPRPSGNSNHKNAVFCLTGNVPATINKGIWSHFSFRKEFTYRGKMRQMTNAT
jgi:hypothetical protein